MEDLEDLTRRAIQQLQTMQSRTEETKRPDPEPSGQPRQQETQSLPGFLRPDSDLLLLLPLVLLLSRDGADNALLLALIFILL